MGADLRQDPDAFEDLHLYRKDRRRYFRTAFSKLMEEFDNSVLEIVKK